MDACTSHKSAEQIVSVDVTLFHSFFNLKLIVLHTKVNIYGTFVQKSLCFL